MDPDKVLANIIDTARFLLGGEAGDMFEQSVDELAQQVLDLDEWLRRGGFLPVPWRKDQEGALVTSCRGLLQDIAEVLERQGEDWWDETVTSGLHHRQEAAKLLGEPSP